MRNAISIAMLAMSFIQTTVSATAETKVFLIAGQSNAAGCGVTADLTAPYDVPLSQVKFWNKCNSIPNNNPGDAWVDLQGGFGHQFYPGLSMFGPEVSFGYRLHQLFPHDDIYLVKYALSSQDLAVHWRPTTGNIYSIFKSRVDAAIANLRAAGKSPVIAGMIWMQGESDAMKHDWAEAYQANLTTLIVKVRSDFSTPNMPFVIGRINNSQHWGTPADNTLVRNAQMKVASQVSNTSWINTDDISVWNGKEQGHSDPDHYSSQGQIVLGTRFANQLRAESIRNTDSSQQ